MDPLSPYQNSVAKSPNDKNDYYSSVLENGIKYLIIHDPLCDRSACALDISMGSLYNPPDIEGLAHCLEHILFLGTEKYPEKNDFSDFLSKNSGSTNAYTSLEATNFHFDVSNEEIEKALEMFSTFFICPLFTKELVESELNAIDSEYKMDVREDGERLNSIKSIEGYSDSEYSKFVCGNLSTLKRNDIRDKVIEFYHKFYNPTKMSLCVISDKSIDDMKKIIENNFSAIKQNENYVQLFNTEICNKKFKCLYDENNMGNIYNIIPVKNEHRLQLYWVINENGYQYYKAQPFEYIVSLLGHEGKNSLTSYLKKKEMITSLTATYNNQGETFIEVEIEIELTEKGFENYVEVINTVMYFIRKMQNKEVNENYFNEIKKSSEIDFVYYEREDPLELCISLAENLGIYNASEVIKVNYIIENYEPDLIKKCFNALTANNMNVYLLSQKFKFEDNDTNVKIDKWFGTKYTKAPLSSISSLYLTENESFSIDKDVILDYPPKNIFIPNNFGLINFVENKIDINQYTYPKKIVDNIHTIWYKPDSTFKIPKCYISARVYVSNLNLNINTYHIYCKLYSHILNEELSEDAYMGVLSQNSLEILFYDGYVLINVVGFSDPIENYVKLIMSKMKSIKENFEKIENIHSKIKSKLEEMIKHFHNSKLNSVDVQSYIKLDKLLTSPHGDTDKKIKICEDMLSYLNTNNKLDNDFLSFINLLFSKTKFVWLAQGNITPQVATRIIENIETSLSSSPKQITQNEIRKFRITSLSSDVHYSYTFESGDKENENSCVLCFIDIGHKIEKDIKAQSLLRIIEHIFDEDFFDDLRTRQQLGYHVSLERHRSHSLSGLICFVQSSKYHPDLIVEKINDFFVDFDINDNENFNDEDFNSYKNAVINNLKEKDLTLCEEFERNFALVVGRDYQFDKKEKMIECIRTDITKKDVIDFFNEKIYKKIKRIDIKCIGKNTKKEIEKKKNEDKMDVDENEEEEESELSTMPSLENIKEETIKDIEAFHHNVNHFDELYY